jgi:segregation and condensation protein A
MQNGAERTHTVAVGEFEGPLGLLLELVERNRLEVTAISVAQITESYLERIRALGDQPPEELSEFLQLGARLLYIKSLALLPAESQTEQGEELTRLSLELEEYRRMQTAARELSRRSSVAESWHRGSTERLEPHELPPPTIDLEQLAAAFSRALRRSEPVRATGIIREHVSLEEMTTRLNERLKNSSFDLKELLDSCRDRAEIIVAFLALLEQIRVGAVRVTQDGQFTPIIVGSVRA